MKATLAIFPFSFGGRETMGADGAFDRRRKELALLAGKKEEEISQDEVSRSSLFLAREHRASHPD
jgi:hypothetical protein